MSNHPVPFRILLLPTTLVVLALFGCAQTQQKDQDPYQPEVFCSEFSQIGWIWPVGNAEPVPYVPREGDILFSSTSNPRQSLAYKWIGGIGLPHHMFMIIRNSSGQLCTFEVGAGGDKTVAIRPVYTRLHKHKELYDGSVIAIRQIKRSLTANESTELTQFAEAQVGKKFSTASELLKLALPRRPAEQSNLEQKTWFCSEIVVYALEHIGLIRCLDNAGKIVPEDFYYDKKFDIGSLWTQTVEWTPDAAPTKYRPKLDPISIENRLKENKATGNTRQNRNRSLSKRRESKSRQSKSKKAERINALR